MEFGPIVKVFVFVRYGAIVSLLSATDSLHVQ